MPKCPICNGEMKLRFSAPDHARPNDDTEWKLNWCDICDFGRLEGEFNAVQVAGFYPDNYYTHGSVRQKPDEQSTSFIERLRTNLAWRFDWGRDFHPRELKTPAGAVCDIGCGSGNILRLWKAAGYRTVGIEPDPLARVQAANAGQIFEGTAENLPSSVPLRSFDVVQMSHVLEHCIDPLLAIANAKRLLVKGGTLILEVPNNAAFGFSRFQALWPPADISRHLSFFTEKSLRLLLRANGLEVRQTIYTGYTRQFLPDWIAKQSEISKAINGTAANFDTRAWLLLVRSALANARRKYDAIRVHAQ